MQNNIFLIVIVVIVVGVGLFAIVQYFKRKGMSWSGVVIDKSFTETQVSNSNSRSSGSTLSVGGFGVNLGQRPQAVNITYYLVVKTDDGKELRWNVGEGLYGTINIGDRLRKSPGSMTPEVVK